MVIGLRFIALPPLLRHSSKASFIHAGESLAGAPMPVIVATSYVARRYRYKRALLSVIAKTFLRSITNHYYIAVVYYTCLPCIDLWGQLSSARSIDRQIYTSRVKSGILSTPVSAPRLLSSSAISYRSSTKSRGPVGQSPAGLDFGQVPSPWCRAASERRR